MFEQGVSKARLNSVASMLLHVVRLLDLETLRLVDVAEIQGAGHRWESGLLTIIKRGRGLKSHQSFEWVAFKWLRFHNQIDIPTAPQGSADLMVGEFANFLNVTRGLSLQTIRGFESRSHQFLIWVQDRHESLSTVSLNDIDSFIGFKRDAGCQPRTIASICAALRAFFRYAQLRGWNNSRIARGIHSPRVPRYDGGTTRSQMERCQTDAQPGLWQHASRIKSGGGDIPMLDLRATEHGMALNFDSHLIQFVTISVSSQTAHVSRPVLPFSAVKGWLMRRGKMIYLSGVSGGARGTYLSAG